MAIFSIKLLHPWLLASSCRFSFSSIPFSASHPALSTSNAHSAHSNLFAEFAATKFNLSSADIAFILKHNRSLDSLQTLDGVERFVDTMKKHGCIQHQIASIMRKMPQLLTASPEKFVEPKIQVLRDLGFEGEVLAKILTCCPKILASSVQRSLLPSLTFLKNTYKTRDLLIKAISYRPSVLTYDLDKYLKPSVAFWEGCGLSGEQLAKALSSRPGLLLCTSLTPARAHLIQKIGIDSGSRTYNHVLITVARFRTESLEAKINNFRQLGLTAEETMELFRVSPPVYSLSEETVRQKFGFIVSEMGLPPHSVVKVPDLLIMSLEKVVKPRLLVLQKIISLNGDEQVLRRIASVIRMSEANFVRKVIMERHASTLLNEIYQEALTNASRQSKMKARVNNSKKYHYF